jgi:hypothetical protein
LLIFCLGCGLKDVPQDETGQAGDDTTGDVDIDGGGDTDTGTDA